MRNSKLFVGGALIALLGATSPAFGQTTETPVETTAETSVAETVAEPDTMVDDLVVIGRDRVGLLEVRPSSTVFGLAKPLVETPRAATFVSEQTIERYGVEEVDDLTVITPGAFTASFYGVKGAVNLRGTLAEAYFRGFKRIENRGTYATPLGAASQVDILRGPPAAFTGPGKVGGYLNIVPKTARTSRGGMSGPTGQAEVTVGSYDKFNVALEGGIPYVVGDIDGGVYGYAEYDNSDSFYRGIHPESSVFQLSSEMYLPNGIKLSAGAMRFDSSGNVQTPGWNRVTQQLIDEQLYITGRDTTLVDTDGSGYLTPNESGALSTGYFNFTPTPPASFSLDTGVGLATLDRRTVYIAPEDFSETTTNTFYFDVAKTFSPTSTLKLQAFYDDLENERFVSYGFPAAYDSSAVEARLTYDFQVGEELKKINYIIGASYRVQKARKRESFNGGYIALDRRDIIFGPTPTDVYDSPFNVDPAGVTGLGWDFDNKSKYKDTGVFIVSDLTLGGLGLLLAGRYDYYDVEANDTGTLTFQSPAQAGVSDSATSFSASLSYKTPWGFVPYATYAESAALEVGQAGDIAPSLIASDQWLSDSKLTEGGVKFSLMNDRLVGGLSVYKQSRTRLTLNNNVVKTEAEGVELEIRWLATDNLSFTVAANNQETTIKGPDRTFFYIPVASVGLSGQQGYGGAFAEYNFSTCSCGYPGDYELTTIPNTVFSLYGSWVSDRTDWGQWGVTTGAQYVSETSGVVRNAAIYPDYILANLSAFVTYGETQLSVNVDNVFDEMFFQPLSDTYTNVGVLPGKGREFRVTLKQNF